MKVTSCKKIVFIIELSANKSDYLTQSYKSWNNSHLIHLYRKNKTSPFRPRYFLETYYGASISSYFHFFFFKSKYIQSIFCLTWNSFSFISFYVYVYSHSFYFDFGGQHRIKRLNKQTQRKDGGRKAPAIACSPLAWFSSSISVKRSTECDSPRSPTSLPLGRGSIKIWGTHGSLPDRKYKKRIVMKVKRGIYDKKNSHYWIFANSIEKETNVNERLRLRAAIKLSKGIFYNNFSVSFFDNNTGDFFSE